MVLGSYHAAIPRLHKYAEPSANVLPTGAVVLAPNYRLASSSGGITADVLIDDCYATWRWLVDHADELRVDLEKIVIGGESAGGGLAAALSQRIRDDEQGPRPILQLLIYPMLDDRTVLRIEQETVPSQSYYPIWTPKSNRYGWTNYLGHLPASDRHSSYVPARRKDLSGLPSAFIGVGDLDLFHQEDVDYSRRLKEAGVDVQVEVVKGALHGFDLFEASISKRFWKVQCRAMREALQ